MLTLKPGDVIRGRSTGESYIVTAHYGDHVTAVRTADVTNPGEWDVMRIERGQPGTPDAGRDIAVWYPVGETLP